MNKKILLVIRDMIGHFAVYYGVAFLCDKIWGLDAPVWTWAMGCSIGWFLWEVMEYGYKKLKMKEDEKRKVGE